MFRLEIVSMQAIILEFCKENFEFMSTDIEKGRINWATGLDDSGIPKSFIDMITKSLLPHSLSCCIS